MFWHVSVLVSVHRGGQPEGGGQVPGGWVRSQGGGSGPGGVRSQGGSVRRGGQVPGGVSQGWVDQVPGGSGPRGVSWGKGGQPGGYPVRTTEGVVTTWRAVCLLRSRRRTFLLICVYVVKENNCKLWRKNNNTMMFVVESWRENCVVGSLKSVFCLNFVLAEDWKFRSIWFFFIFMVLILQNEKNVWEEK